MSIMPVSEHLLSNTAEPFLCNNNQVRMHLGVRGYAPVSAAWEVECPPDS
jgi:hypothetical protein